jgi:pyrrolysyl-tRNA synthetase-like protein
VTISWSEIQTNRLKALEADQDLLSERFEDETERDRAFQELEGQLVRRRRQELCELRAVHGRPGLCRLETRLVETLVRNGFVQVATPTIMSRGLLDRMGVSRSHPLADQVFWLNDGSCLRPMLAPHLYYVVKDLLRLWERPVGIFEVGSCFRKDSEGARHSQEFTMINVCEFGVPEADREGRLRELAELVTLTSGIGEFRLEASVSSVYGETLDVLSRDGLELGSGAMGPHPLDHAWRITDPWVGIGFGLERLLMTASGSESIGKMGRSLAYLDGIPLKI